MNNGNELNQLLPGQPLRVGVDLIADKNSGALEGCLINIAANKNNIPIHSGKIPSVFDCFYHYGPRYGHTTKVNKSIL